MKNLDIVMDDGWDTIEPDFVNEEETKWWVDEDMMQYLGVLEEKHNIKWKEEIACWLVERKDGYRTRIIIVDNKPAYESQKMEFAAAFLDVKAVTAAFEKNV